MWPLRAKEIYEIIMNNVCENKDFNNIIIHGISQDSRKINSEQMFVAIKGDNFDGHNYLKKCFENNVQLALVQKESPVLLQLTTTEKKKCIFVDNVTESLRKLAKFVRKSFNFPIIGIGGSNGKTTTKEILYSMLLGNNNKVTKTEKSENGYLGLAITLLQEGHSSSHPPSALVLEIGIDEVGAMKEHIEIAKPNIVLLTALGPEHLTGLHNWETAAKEELILFSLPEAIKIWQLTDQKIKESYFEKLKDKNLNFTHDYVVIEKKEYEKYLSETINFNNKIKKEIIWEILNENNSSVDIQIEVPYLNTQNNMLSKFTLPLPGKHNAANFAVAFAAALSAGKTIDEISTGFSKFIPPPMRSNMKTLSNGILLYNDAYNASPLSVEAALLVLENPLFINKPKLVVLGDMLELGSESIYWHEYLVPTIIKMKQTHLCLYGSAMYSCYKLLQQIKDNLDKEGTSVFWLDAHEDPGCFFNKIGLLLPSTVVLVKGSRGMKLERFVNVLEDKYRSS